jgi:hypothetical protein
MSVYRIIWWVMAVPLAAVGAAVAVVTVHVDELASAAFAAAVVGGGVSWGVATSRNSTVTLRSCLPAIARTAAAVGTILVSVVGLISLSGIAAVPLVLMMAVTARPVARWLHSWPPIAQVLGQQGSELGDPVVVTVTGSSLSPPPSWEGLSDDALCRGWRTSFVVLQHTSSVTGRLRIARMRQRYLDEIERRDPQGFAQWFSSGARAGSDPSKFLTPRRPPPPDLH